MYTVSLRSMPVSSQEVRALVDTYISLWTFVLEDNLQAQKKANDFLKAHPELQGPIQKLVEAKK